MAAYFCTQIGQIKIKRSGQRLTFGPVQFGPRIWRIGFGGPVQIIDKRSGHSDHVHPYIHYRGTIKRIKKKFPFYFKGKNYKKFKIGSAKIKIQIKDVSVLPSTPVNSISLSLFTSRFLRFKVLLIFLSCESLSLILQQVLWFRDLILISVLCSFSE